MGYVFHVFFLFVVNFVDPSRSFISDKVRAKVHDFTTSDLYAAELQATPLSFSPTWSSYLIIF